MHRFSLMIFLLLVLGWNGPCPGRDIPEHAVMLMYHHVSHDTPASTSVSPEVFAAHLDFLEENGFRIHSLPEVLAALEGPAALPDSVVVITFDDGYRSVYDTAWPLLRERGWPFTVFVCSEDIDRGHGPVMAWEQLREMGGQGATIASHGRHHHHLQRLRDGEDRASWRRRVRADLEHSRRRIAEMTGQDHQMLAYPFGESDDLLRELVATMGWVALGQQSGAAGPLSDPACLPRFPMATGFADLANFALKAASLPLPVLEVEAQDLLLRFSDESVIIGAEPPVLRLKLRDEFPGLAAYASGQGEVRVQHQDGDLRVVEVQAEGSLPAGRSRYNITAPFARTGRWCWYSHTWIVGQAHTD